MTKPITDYTIPSDIGTEARQYMKALLKSLDDQGIQWNGLDNGILNLIAYEYHKFVESRDLVMKEGFVLRERNARNAGVTKPHPAVKIMYDATSQLRLLYIEFGLTPKSRGKVDALQRQLFNAPLAPFIPNPNSKEVTTPQT